ncbi:hypothetical protein COO91_02543 [Nostoc flagelliforme CCNUN1]|uniref:Uncharacterized protein n=1 Tax=Nostoc flagelliforme CCNUN1 TaxID=2038116 RepID=A0A2K8SME2_9NOSO|nr:hypothetical protein COO91_02543 [Nostoc flagelliforme CCNUN1]
MQLGVFKSLVPIPSNTYYVIFLTLVDEQRSHSSRKRDRF